MHPNLSLSILVHSFWLGGFLAGRKVGYPWQGTRYDHIDTLGLDRLSLDGRRAVLSRLNMSAG